MLLEIQTELNSAQHQLLILTARAKSAELMVSQLEKEKSAITTEKMVYFYF